MSDITSANIRLALSNTYQTPEWYLGFEVGNSTGSNCRRHADAVAINAYPSKGFETRGFEIKVSKQDLKSELEKGIKSDEIARFCDYWFIVVPKGLADGFTLPPTWGVIEYKDGVLRQKVKATLLEKISPTSGFLCSMLRSRERALYEKAQSVAKEKEEQIKQNALWGIKNSETELSELKSKLKEIEDATGISLDRWTPSERIVNRLKCANSLNIIEREIDHIKWGSKELMEDAQKIQDAVNLINNEEGGVE